jgi:hypothetical protein
MSKGRVECLNKEVTNEISNMSNLEDDASGTCEANDYVHKCGRTKQRNVKLRTTIGIF